MNRIFSFFKFFLLTLPVVALLLAPSHLVAQAPAGAWSAPFLTKAEPQSLVPMLTS